MKITDFGYDGEGVGHMDGKVCFVPYTLMGEEVEVDIKKETSTLIKAFPNEVIIPSQKRITPPCPYYTSCGGCDFQHMSYEDEIELKKNILTRQLSKIQFAKDFNIVTSKSNYSYRNKVKFFCGDKGLSLKHAMSEKLVPIDNCLLAKDGINSVIDKINKFILRNKLTKIIDTITVRQVNNIICIKFDFLKEPSVDFTGLSLLLGNKVYLYKSINGKGIARVFGEEIELLENDLKYTFKIDAFRQVNDSVAEKMYQKVCDAVSGGVVLNAYSGAGILSGLLCQKAIAVYGVELGKEENLSAESLKQKNNLDNLTNINGDCKDVIANLKIDFDFVVLDPPRVGCAREVCESINKVDATVIYISCNPASLVRDLGRLNTFNIESVTLFDMFPRTANFEVLTILKKKQN